MSEKVLDKLKPCPLCGNTSPHFDGEYVWCTDEPTVECALSMWPSKPERWNYRPEEARIAAENAALRECVKAADAFFLTEDAMVNAQEEETGKDLWLESLEHRSDYGAARAKVKP